MVVFNNRGVAYFGHGVFSWSDSRVDAYADRGDGGYEKLHPCMFGRDIVYSRIYVVCGILRGLGDSKTPLYFVALACVINIVLDFILVGYFHLGATGAAVATITAQGVSFVISLWFLYRHGFHFEFTRKDIRLNRNLAKKVMTLGAPIALQDALINISFLIITVIVNQMGVIASASLGVVEKIIVFAMLPPMAISSAVATMTAQNYGAGLIQRMNRCLASGIGIALVFGVSVCVYSQFLPENAYRVLYQRCCGGINGGGVSAGI